jgi:hypothetical protein
MIVLFDVIVQSVMVCIVLPTVSRYTIIAIIVSNISKERFENCRDPTGSMGRAESWGNVS